MSIKVNEEVLIQHAVVYGKGGAPFIAGARRQIIQKVAAVYIDGRIRTSSGDVWDVTRNGAGKLQTALPVVA